MSNNTNDELLAGLTEDQTAAAYRYRDEYHKIATDTTPTDKEKAEKAIIAGYEFMHRNDTDKKDYSKMPFTWANNPIEAAHIAYSLHHDVPLASVTTEQAQTMATTANHGSFEAYWLATYAFMSEVLNNRQDPLIEIAKEIVNQSGTYWNFEYHVVVCPKPSEVHTKDGKLHNTTGPAVVYADGYSIYVANGVRRKSLMEAALASFEPDDIQNFLHRDRDTMPSLFHSKKPNLFARFVTFLKGPVK